MKFIHFVSGNASPHTIRSVISKGTQEDNDKIAFKKVCRCQTMKGHVTTYLIVDWSDIWYITWKSFFGDYEFSTRLNFVCNLKINLNILYSFKNNVLCYPLIYLLTFMLRSFLLYSNRIWRIGVFSVNSLYQRVCTLFHLEIRAFKRHGMECCNHYWNNDHYWNIISIVVENEFQT